MAAVDLESIGMTGVHRHAIERLSNELHLLSSKVAPVYWTQLDRIGASARIDHYLSILAARNARSVLRRGPGMS